MSIIPGFFDTNGGPSQISVAPSDIKFTNPNGLVYGSFANPLTGALTFDTQYPVLEGMAIIYHTGGDPLNPVPANFVITSYAYDPTKVNKIYLVYNSGKIIASSLTAVTVAGGAAPVASAVDITGTVESGSQITGIYTWSDADVGDVEQNSLFYWRTTDDGGQTTQIISGANAINYTPVVGDEGKEIAFGVAPGSDNLPSPGTIVWSPWYTVAQGIFDFYGLSGILTAFDTSKPLTITASGTTPNKLFTSSVDASPSSNRGWTQAATVAPPRYDDSDPNPDNHFLELTDTDLHTIRVKTTESAGMPGANDPRTMIFVQAVTHSGTGFRYFWHGGSGANMYLQDGLFKINNGTVSASGTDPLLVDSALHIWIITSETGDFNAWVDNKLILNVASHKFNWDMVPNNWYGSAANTSYSPDGQLRFISVLNRVITAQERSDIFNQFAAKYGITLQP